MRIYRKSKLVNFIDIIAYTRIFIYAVAIVYTTAPIIVIQSHDAFIIPVRTIFFNFQLKYKNLKLLQISLNYYSQISFYKYLMMSIKCACTPTPNK